MNRMDLLKSLINKRLMVIDGAMGTAIQDRNLTANDFGGAVYEGCNEHLVITRPDIISGIHESYLDAGADIIETNTFGATSIVLDEYGLAHKSRQINFKAATIARKLADSFSSQQKPRFVAGSMGPTTKTISVTGGITFDSLVKSYQEQAAGLIEGGVDVLLLETSQDTINVKAGLVGIHRAFNEVGKSIHIAIQGTIETMGTLLAGQSVEAFYISLSHIDLLWIGLNCATGPEFMADHIRALSDISRFPIACVPNAGLPDENGDYTQTPNLMATTIERFVNSGWVNLIGGCCGTTSEHIRLLNEVTVGKPVRKPVKSLDTCVSGIESLTINQQTRPAIVGERTNVLGSRKFRRLIDTDEIDEATEIGRRQVRNGAHILDVCLQDPDRDELSDITTFLELLTKKVKVPIMIDSTDANVIEESLKRLQGKSIINSINLEDGEERFKTIIPLAKQYGAALVVGCIDDDPQQAQAITRKRKLDIALRSYKLLTEKYGIAPQDIIFDPLVFPAGTGDKNYVGSAAETIEGIRIIKKNLPLAKTILGISNVSFGLPPAGRDVLNSVFLYHCVQAGLDMAIVNSEQLQRYTSIPPIEIKLSENLIWDQGQKPIDFFANHFREKKPIVTSEEMRNLPLDQRLSTAIIEGIKNNLVSDLNEALSERTALQIINGPLMDGMAEVGRQFNANKLIVAEVLQSAEAMKYAVSYLEKYMEKLDTISKGRILLATVKGDVHDIGKNLVDIILSNNGYDVVNLGIKVLPQELISAYKDHKPDIIGLSGLLVKSAQMMVETVREFKVSDIKCPVMVGGAALSNRFTRTRIAPEYDGLVAYANDAMSGLELANVIQNEQTRNHLFSTLYAETLALSIDSSKVPHLAINKVARAQIRHDIKIPIPPDLKLHVLKDYPLEDIFHYINPQMLYVRHLGFKGKFEQALKSGNESAKELFDAVRRVEDVMLSRSDITANAVYRFFPCDSHDQRLFLYEQDRKTILENFYFGRQSDKDGLCISDYIQPRDSKITDYIAMFITTIGQGVRNLAHEWQERGEYLNSHILLALAIESAEAFAELLHQKIRYMWGFSDGSDITNKDLFRAQYRGKRYSFGYPACPILEDQSKLFRQLDATANIGVVLTDGYMMDPEASVSAMVIHHPDAKYFNLNALDIEKLETEYPNTINSNDLEQA